MKPRAFIPIWLAVTAVGCPAVHAAELRARAAKLEITPPVGHQLWGLSSRAGPSTGILDPLYARILVLKSDLSSLAIVAVDLGRPFDPEQIAELRARVKVESGIEHVIVAASHTHTGPTVLNKKHVEPHSARWEPKVLDAIRAAINRAAGEAVPCHVAAGKGASYIGYNRFDLVAGGHWLWQNPTRVRTSPMDPVVQVVRLDDHTGKPIAVMVNYASHPVVLDTVESTRYSADFPGVMADYVERTLPGSPVCLFIQGACGDINSLYVHQVQTQQMQMLGRELGREVVRVAGGLRPEASLAPEVRVIAEQMTFRARWDLEKLKELSAVPTYYQWLVEGRPRGFPPDPVAVFVTTALINRQVAVLTMPGEPFVDFQIAFRDRLPGIDTILAGYTDGYVGYIPTIRAAVRDGVVYGANAWPTILEAGAGERIVDRGVVNVYRMLGRLKDRPDPVPAAVWEDQQ